MIYTPETIARFETKYTKGPGCWIWQGYTRGRGYGAIKIGSLDCYAHRVAYELAVGPIPGDMTIDHLCREKRCVNPTHFEVVTRAENTRRASLKDKCLRGHSDWRPHARGRHCGTCAALYQQERRRRAKQCP